MRSGMRAPEDSPRKTSGMPKRLAACFTFYSFIGIEMAAVASGEVKDPEVTIPRSYRTLVFGLSLIYIVTTAVLVGIIPWNSFGVTESPFVSVLKTMGIPGAASVMNFVVLTAAFTASRPSGIRLAM